MLNGRCLCGSVRYRINGVPLLMYHCHCSQCRRANGSSFATNLLARREDLELSAGGELLASYESSPGEQRLFCSRCGSPIYSRSVATPKVFSVRCGTLDGDPGLRPSAHIFVGSKSPWFEICDDLPQNAESLAST